MSKSEEKGHDWRMPYCHHPSAMDINIQYAVQTDRPELDLKRYFLFNDILLSYAKSKFIEEVNSFRSNLDLEYFHLTEGDLVTITKTVNVLIFVL